jgi:hypothetical protein
MVVLVALWRVPQGSVAYLQFQGNIRLQKGYNGIIDGRGQLYRVSILLEPLLQGRRHPLPIHIQVHAYLKVVIKRPSDAVQRKTDLKAELILVTEELAAPCLNVQ